MKHISFLIIAAFLCSCKGKMQSYNCNIITSEIVSEVSGVQFKNDIQKITYWSDSLKIAGFIVTPKSIIVNEMLPLIIFNRGGNKDFGAITDDTLIYLDYLASSGYVVMASQYRGNSFSEGIDEFGGNDVNDIKCLVEIAKTLNYVDIENIGVLGFSRGGLMAYLLSKQTDDIKTYITVGSPTDLLLSSKNRPKLYKDVFYKLIGDSTTNRQAYKDRSPVYWANQLNEPLLILHGTNDKKVDIAESKKLIDSLKKHQNNKISYLFFQDGDHSVSNFSNERNETIMNWFNKHLKNEP